MSASKTADIRARRRFALLIAIACSLMSGAVIVDGMASSYASQTSDDPSHSDAEDSGTKKDTSTGKGEGDEKEDLAPTGVSPRPLQIGLLAVATSSLVVAVVSYHKMRECD